MHILLVCSARTGELDVEADRRLETMTLRQEAQKGAFLFCSPQKM